MAIIEKFPLLALCDAICGWEHINYMRGTGQTRSVPEGVWVQGGGLEIPCMYDVFVKKEHMEQRKTLKEKPRSLKRHAEGTA